MNQRLLMSARATLFATIPLIALAASDFNGSWVRDNAKSDKDSYPLYWLTRGGDAGFGGGGGGDYVITVHQDAASLKLIDPQRGERSYPLDGKPHTVTMDTGLAKATVTAGLQGEKLVIDSVQPYGGMPGNATLRSSEVWALSADGKTLTVTITRDVPASKQSLKQVYTRK
jgi:hypothetical protein